MSCTFCDVKPYLSEEQLAKLDQIVAIQSDVVGCQVSYASVLGYLLKQPAFDQLLNDQYSAYLAMRNDIKPLDKDKE